MGRVSYIVVLAFVLNNVVAATEKGHDYCPVMAISVIQVRMDQGLVVKIRCPMMF